MEEKKVQEKCPNCGYKLKYDPKNKVLLCESCKSTFNIDAKNVALDTKELDYVEVLENLKLKSFSKVEIMKCEECGASVSVDPNRVSFTCPYCGSNKAIKENVSETPIPVSGVIPFSYDEEKAQEIFSNWINKKKLAPNALKKHFLNPEFYPIYLPYYTYDAKTLTKYLGERGDYYYVTVTVRDANGETHQERERRTRWTTVSGTVRRAFDDVLVIASSNDVFNKYIHRISNFNPDIGKEFDSGFLLGYYAQIADVHPRDGFAIAKIQMKRAIEFDVESDIGGDEQEIRSLDTSYSDVKCKQIMMPVYNGIYKYNGTTYSFAINGQNGSFYGKAPVSGAKIFFYIILPILIFVILMVLVIVSSAE